RNNTANVSGGVLGGSGATLGTAPQYGATPTLSDDIVLIKYVDNGASASVGWSQVGGGIGYDGPTGVAASGGNVYVVGYLANNSTNSQQAVFGGSGTTPGTAPQYGASAGTGPDILLAKYVDNGSSGALGWTQIAGGYNNDSGQAVAVSGNNVYVVGTMTGQQASASPNSYATFGGSGTAAGTVRQFGASATNSSDLVVAKYVDSGASASVAWTQVGGGTDEDKGRAIAVQGNGVYVVGTIKNTSPNANSVVFGGSGATPGTAAQPGATIYTSDDVVVARYNDQGSSSALAWTQLAGGSGNDYVTGVAATSAGLYVVGSAPTPATFGNYTLSGPPESIFGYIGTFGATALPVRAATAGASGLALYPNPTHGSATLAGSAPGAAVQLLDALGRVVATTTADASGTVTLGRLPAGFYLVRVGSQAVRLVME
ncbi:MAG: T9SS type A sorting domain-containing protein, partial [Hymenobacter sp.]